MTEKMIGITKAAIAGAAFGGVIGMVTTPKSRKKAKRHSIAENTGDMLRTVGSAMQDVADIIHR